MQQGCSMVGVAPTHQDLAVAGFSLLPQTIRISIFIYHVARNKDELLARLYYDTDGQDAASWFEHEMGWHSFFFEFAKQINYFVLWEFQQDFTKAKKLFERWMEDWRDFMK